MTFECDHCETILILEDKNAKDLYKELDKLGWEMGVKNEHFCKVCMETFNNED